MNNRSPEVAAQDAFARTWGQWKSLSLADGETLEEESLYKFGPSTYVTESLSGDPGALVWAVNDYWALKCVSSEILVQDVDRGVWMPPGLCGLPDGYRQREVLDAANKMDRKFPATVDGVYNFGTGDFEYTQIDATYDISVFYDTRDTDSDNGPVFITFAPGRIGPIQQNLTSSGARHFADRSAARTNDSGGPSW